MMRANMSSSEAKLASGGPRTARPRQWFWLLPAALALVMGAGSWGVWKYERWKHQQELARETDLLCQNLAREIEATIRDRIRPLRRVRNDMRDGRIATEAQFREAAKSLQVVLPIFTAITRIDRDGGMLVEPPSAADLFTRVPQLQKEIGDDPEWASPVEFDESDPYVIVLLTADWTAQGRRDVTLAGKLRIGGLLTSIISAIPSRYQISVRDQAGVEVTARASEQARVLHARSDVFWVTGRPWTVALEWRATVREEALSTWALVGGLLLSVVLPGAVGQWLLQRWKETQGARQRASDLAAVAEDSVQLNSMLGTGQDLFGPVLKMSMELVGLPAGVIGILEENDTMLRIEVSRGLDPSPTGRRFPRGEIPIISGCVESGETFVSEDVVRDGRPINPEVLRKYNIRSLVVMPLTSQGRRIGAMVLSDSVPHRFAEREIQLARLWGAQASAILTDHHIWQQMSRVMEEQKRMLEQREVLYDMHQRLYATDGLESALQDLTDTAAPALEVDFIGISLLEGGGQNLRIAALTRDAFAKSPIGAIHPARGGFVGAAMESGEVLVTEDASLEPRLMPAFRERFGIGSAIAVPLIGSGGERLGAMVLIRHEPGPIAPGLVVSASVFGGRVAQAIQTTRLLKQTSEALDGQRKLLDQREMLYAIHQRLYTADRLEDEMQALTDLAPAPLEVDAIGVSLLEEDGEHLCMRAFTQAGQAPGPTAIGYRYAVKETFAELCLASGKVCCVEDASKATQLERRISASREVESIMMVPLIGTGGEKLGVLGCVRHRVGAFSQGQIELAAMFGARVAQAIQMTALLRQTRRDAETQSVLLRELNHRVNNNLAAIVGLLSDPPDGLPENARRWLDRVPGRIVTMARTHAMFLGTGGGASLKDIVTNALAALAVLKRPGVEIRTELPDASKEVTITQAVALAMVLHELCANALQHGIGERGVLTIRGSICHDRVIQIDVIDDGSASSVNSGGMKAIGPRGSVEAVPGIGGMGLQLARELVRRELNGEFWSEAREGGGRKACVRFGAGFPGAS